MGVSRRKSSGRPDRVRDGIVVSATPKADDVEIKVAFKGEAGMKRLLQSFASLQRVVA